MNRHSRKAGWLPGVLKRAYALFLLAYPAAFWQTYAEEMSEVFAEQVDEAAGRGLSALLALAVTEFWHTALTIPRAYWNRRGRFLSAVWALAARFFHVLLQPEPPGTPDGRTSWRRALLESGLLAVWGVGLLLSTYLPMPWKRLFNPLTLLVLFVPLAWLLVGLARGMPRWAYPALGILLGYGFIASLATNLLPLFGMLLLLVLVLLAWAWKVDRRRPFLPRSIRAWGTSLSASSSAGSTTAAAALLSFGMYGFLALAIMIAFDNAYANNNTPWLLVSVLCMLGGAAAYSRGRTILAQLGALSGGITLALLAALLDHAQSTGRWWPGPVWIYTLWLNLLILILAPWVMTGVLRFCLGLLARLRGNKRAPRPMQGG